MKIATISTHRRGGAGIAAYRLHKELNKRPGIESVFIQSNQSEVNLQERIIACPKIFPDLFVKVCRKIGLGIVPELSGKRKAVFEFSDQFEHAALATTSYRIEELDEVRNADIVHLHWVTDFINYPSFFRSIQKPIVWTLHDMNPFMGLFHYQNDEERNPQLKAINAEVLQTKIKAVQAGNLTIVGISEWLTEISRQSEAFAAFPHYMIHNGLDFSNHTLIPESERTALQKEYGLGNGHKTLIFIAHNIGYPRKGLKILTDAIGNLDLKVNLITVGGEYIDIAGIEKRLHFTEIRDTNKLNELYSVADLFVMSSIEEAFGLVTIEALSCGTPVVSFPNGGSMDILNAENGTLTASFDSASLADAIRSALQRKYNRAAIMQDVQQRFSIKEKTDRYLDIYNHILRK